jgi:hypothetical protein
MVNEGNSPCRLRFGPIFDARRFDPRLRCFVPKKRHAVEKRMMGEAAVGAVFFFPINDKLWHGLRRIRASQKELLAQIVIEQWRN